MLGAIFVMSAMVLFPPFEKALRNPPVSPLRYDVFSSVGGGGATGLYSGAGRAGLLNGLISFFFGFLFSRPRLSRLPMTFSFLLAL